MSLATLDYKQALNYTGQQKLPLILQTEAAECGLACLAMVSGFYGCKNDIITLRNRFTFSTHGTNLKQLSDMASRLNMSSRALRLEVNEIFELQIPCILHWDMCHFVVLKSVKNQHVTIHDPAHGERKLSLKEFSSHFTGVALELYPTEEFEQKNEVKLLKLSYFWKGVLGLKSALVHIFLLSLILQIFSVVSPFYMQTVVDDVIVKSDTNLLLILAIAFGALFLIQCLTNTLREYMILHISTKFNLKMSSGLFHHLIRLPLDYFEKRHMGDIVSRFRSIEDIKNLLTTKFVSALVDSLMAIVTLIAMLIYSVKLAIFVCVFVILYGFIRALLYKPYKAVNEQYIIADAKEDSCFMESIRAIQTIKVFKKETDRQNVWQNSYVESLNGHIKQSRWNISFGLTQGVLFGLENIIIIYIAANLVIENLMTLGMLYAFMSYKQQFIDRMNGLVSVFIDFKLISMHLERLSDIVFTPKDNHFKNNLLADHHKKDVDGNLKINNLFFRYGESEPYVLNGINLSINKGESVALVAPSGFGKTTLLKCMMGLLVTEKGEVLIDGCNINTHIKFRDQIAGVMQDDQLLTGTIAENIACFDPKIDWEWLEDCARNAAIHDEICKMTMQYHTLVGDMGTSLSGGQRQRIFLARALYRKPKVLFLDEATSHLDSNNESIVNENIQRLNITRVIVAHRQETIALADRAIYLE